MFSLYDTIAPVLLQYVWLLSGNVFQQVCLQPKIDDLNPLYSVSLLSVQIRCKTVNNLCMYLFYTVLFMHL